MSFCMHVQLEVSQAIVKFAPRHKSYPGNTSMGVLAQSVYCERRCMGCRTSACGIRHADYLGVALCGRLLM